MYSVEEIINGAEKLNVKFDKFSIENDDLILTMKIALAHLNEFPNYYNKDYGLPMFERFLKNKNLH